MNFKGAIVFTTNRPSTLGIANRIEIVRYLSQTFDVTIYTNQVDFISKLFPDCAVVRLPLRSNSKVSIVDDFRQWKRIAAEINKRDSDFVFLIYLMSPVALYLNKPVFQYVHQYGRRSEAKVYWVKSFLNSFLTKYKDHLILKGLRESKLNFVISRAIIEILTLKGLKNLQLTPHGMDLQKYQRPAISEAHKPLQLLKNQGYFIVTYTGWVTENRGFKLMLNSLKEVVRFDQKVALVVAGADEAFSQKIEKFSRKNDLYQHIVNYGLVDSSLIPGILYYSDVCLSFLDDVPAYRISPPQKIIEYFAAGKPVICNRIEPHEWLVENGETGLILESDPEIVAKNILKLKVDKSRYNKMVKNVREAAEQYEINKVYGIMAEKINSYLIDVQRKF
jgi:glycosyltransferase involved in cell wall biosynthesis